MYRKWAVKALTEQDISYRVAYSSPSTTGVLAAVKAGLAVAPVGASIPLSGFRILPNDVLRSLPSSVVSLHQSEKKINTVQTYLAQYITEEFRSMPFVASRPRLVK